MPRHTLKLVICLAFSKGVYLYVCLWACVRVRGIGVRATVMKDIKGFIKFCGGWHEINGDKLPVRYLK